MFCVGCGEELEVDADTCAACGTAAIGAAFDERVHVRHGDRVRTPTACCCCLSPADVDVREEHSETGYGGRRTLRVPMPWCEACRGVRRRTGWLILGAAVACHALVFAALSRVLADGSLAFFLGFLAALVGGALAPLVARPLRASARWPGHVAGCAAVGARVGRSEATLTLRNRAFARIWRDLQAGRVPTRPALAWTARKPMPSAPVERAPELAGARQKNLAAEALTRAREAASQQARTASRPVRGVVASAPKVGVDATAEVLRFVVKECVFDEDGVLARYGDGRERRVRFDELGEVVLRQLPAGPPFSATHVLDLVPVGGAAPLRLLPSTRANYVALPGRGMTSQENFRRLAAHVVERNPRAAIEPASLPFVRDAKAAPRVDAIQQFLDYDARYA